MNVSRYVSKLQHDPQMLDSHLGSYLGKINDIGQEDYEKNHFHRDKYISKKCTFYALLDKVNGIIYDKISNIPLQITATNLQATTDPWGNPAIRHTATNSYSLGMTIDEHSFRQVFHEINQLPDGSRNGITCNFKLNTKTSFVMLFASNIITIMYNSINDEITVQVGWDEDNSQQFKTSFVPEINKWYKFEFAITATGAYEVDIYIDSVLIHHEGLHSGFPQVLSNLYLNTAYLFSSLTDNDIDVEFSELMFFRGTTNEDLNGSIRQYYEYEKPEVYFDFDKSINGETVNNFGTSAYTGTVVGNTITLKDANYEKNICLFNDTNVVVNDLQDIIDYSSERYIKFNYQLKDISSVGKYPILCIPNSTSSPIKKLHIYILKDLYGNGVCLQFIFTNNIKQYEKYYAVPNDLNIHQVLLHIPTDLETDIDITFDGTQSVLQDDVDSTYKPQIWFQFNDTPTDGGNINNDGALNITGTLTNPNYIPNFINGTNVVNSTYPSYTCIYVDTVGNHTLQITSDTDITCDVLLIGAGGYGGKNAGGGGGGGGVVDMTGVVLTSGSSVDIHVGQCTTNVSEGDTWFNNAGTITTAGRGGDGGYLDVTDKVTVSIDPYEVVYSDSIMKTIYALNQNCDITVNDDTVQISITENDTIMFYNYLKATDYKYDVLDYLLYTNTFTDYDGVLTDTNNLNMILWLKFEDGTYLIDSSPNDYAFSIANGNVFFDSVSKVKGSYSLDYRSSLYPEMDIYLTSTDLFTSSTTDWSVCVWVKLYTVNTNQTIIDHDHSLYLGINSNKFTVKLGDGINTWGTPFTSFMYSNEFLQTWNHVSVVKSDGLIKLFVNGYEVLSTAVTTYNQYPTANQGIFSFCGNAGVYQLDGWIDDLRIYNFSLSSTRVINVMNGVKIAQNYGFKTPQPIIHYKFDGDLTDEMGGSDIVLGTGMTTADFSSSIVKKGSHSFRFLDTGLNSGGNPGVYGGQFTTSITWNTNTICFWSYQYADYEGIKFYNTLFSFGDRKFYFNLRGRGTTGLLYFQMIINGNNVLTNISCSNARFKDKWVFWSFVLWEEGGDTKCSIYIDGILQETLTFAATSLPTSTTNNVICALSADSQTQRLGFGAYIDDFVIYDKVLDINEINTVMNEGVSIDELNPTSVKRLIIEDAKEVIATPGNYHTANSSVSGGNGGGGSKGMAAIVGAESSGGTPRSGGLGINAYASGSGSTCETEGNDATTSQAGHAVAGINRNYLDGTLQTYGTSGAGKQSGINPGVSDGNAPALNYGSGGSGTVYNDYTLTAGQSGAVLIRIPYTGSRTVIQVTGPSVPKSYFWDGNISDDTDNAYIKINQTDTQLLENTFSSASHTFAISFWLNITTWSVVGDIFSKKRKSDDAVRFAITKENNYALTLYHKGQTYVYNIQNTATTGWKHFAINIMGVIGLNQTVLSVFEDGMYQDTSSYLNYLPSLDEGCEIFIGDLPTVPNSEISPLGIADFRIYKTTLSGDEVKCLASKIDNSQIGASKSVFINNTINYIPNNMVYLENLQISSKPIRPVNKKYSDGKSVIKYTFDSVHHTVINTGYNNAYDLLVKNYTFNTTQPIIKYIFDNVQKLYMNRCQDGTLYCEAIPSTGITQVDAVYFDKAIQNTSSDFVINNIPGDGTSWLKGNFSIILTAKIDQGDSIRVFNNNTDQYWLKAGEIGYPGTTVPTIGTWETSKVNVYAITVDTDNNIMRVYENGVSKVVKNDPTIQEMTLTATYGVSFTGSIIESFEVYDFVIPLDEMSSYKFKGIEIINTESQSRIMKSCRNEILPYYLEARFLSDETDYDLLDFPLLKSQLYISFSFKDCELDTNNTYDLLRLKNASKEVIIYVDSNQLVFEISNERKKATIKNTDLNFWEVVFDVDGGNILSVLRDGVVPSLTTETHAPFPPNGDYDFTILDSTNNNRCLFGNLTIA